MRLSNEQWLNQRCPWWTKNYWKVPSRWLQKSAIMQKSVSSELSRAEHWTGNYRSQVNFSVILWAGTFLPFRNKVKMRCEPCAIWKVLCKLPTYLEVPGIIIILSASSPSPSSLYSSNSQLYLGHFKQQSMQSGDPGTRRDFKILSVATFFKNKICTMAFITVQEGLSISIQVSIHTDKCSEF